jgi:hypothetical protein
MLLELISFEGSVGKMQNLKHLTFSKNTDICLIFETFFFRLKKFLDSKKMARRDVGPPASLLSFDPKNQEEEEAERFTKPIKRTRHLQEWRNRAIFAVDYKIC